MLRRTITGAGASALLAVSLLAAPTAPALADGSDEFGRVSAPDQRLRDGCHRYRVNYVIGVPGQSFSGYVQIYSPRGRKVTGSFIDTGPRTPKRGTVRFELCDNSVTQGRWKAVLKVIYQPDSRDQRRGRSKPTFFQLRR